MVPGSERMWNRRMARNGIEGQEGLQVGGEGQVEEEEVEEC